MASTVSELIWIKQLLGELGIKHQAPIKFFCDNQAARHIASNPVLHEITKHIKINCHFMQEKIRSKAIETPYVKSEDQLAVAFTKGLELKPFRRNINKLGMIDPYSPLT
jgi:hypothetical protein